MSEQRHTPGPWAYRPEKYDDWGFVRASDGALVAAAKDSSVPFAAFDEYRTRKADPYEANARLIAAAPELLEALKGISDMFMSRPDMVRAIKPLMGPAEMLAFDLASKAIAKAEGK